MNEVFTAPRTFHRALLIPCLMASGLQCTSSTAHDLRIDHVTIVSPERSRPMPESTVYIQGDRIVSISRRPPSGSARGPGTAVEVVDGKGLYLAPGLIDSHVHTSGAPGMGPSQEQAHPDLARAAREQVPRSFLYFGFTTLVDLNSEPQQLRAWNAHELHPDLYFCGGAAVVDGYPMNWTPKPERYQQFPYLVVQRGEESTAPEGIDPAAHTPEAVVSRMKADGAICVKSYFDRGLGGALNLPVPRLDTMRELVRAAHAAQIPVLLHATGSEAQTFALEAGVDVIAHGLWYWDGEPQTTSDLTPTIKNILDRVVEGKVGWQPTMQVLYGFVDLFNPEYLSDPRLERVLPTPMIAWYRSPEGQSFHDVLARGVLPKPLLESRDAAAQWDAARNNYNFAVVRNRNATGYLATRNAHLLFGTDTPATPTYANPPGLNGWLEMHRLVEAGVTPVQVFRAATLSNAQALGLSREIGTVQIGKRANLLLLRENPAQTIQAYDEIVKILLHGRVVGRSELAANRTMKP